MSTRRATWKMPATVVAGWLSFLLGAACALAGGVDAKLPPYTATRLVAGEATCVGGSTMQSLVQRWADAFRQRHPDALIRVDTASALSADGFAALMAGKADCVMYVREPFASERKAYRDRHDREPLLVNVAGGSHATRSGTHALAVYVNASNPIDKLTLAQLDALLSSERRRGGLPITRWGELGLEGKWANRPVAVYGMLGQRETGNPPGIVNFLQQRVLLGGLLRADIREQRDKPGESALQAIVQRVAEDPGGIGYSGFSYAVPGVKRLALAEAAQGPFFTGTPEEIASRAYPLSRSIYLLLEPNPSPVLLEFVSWALSREGQQGVANDAMHFIPLSPRQAEAARAQLASP